MSDRARDFTRHLRELSSSGRRSRWKVFDDFCELAYCALAKPAQAEPERRERLEARYMETVGRYSREEAHVFPQMLALVTGALAGGPADFLGEIYEGEGFSDKKYGGQFFTPWHLCEAMALLTIGHEDPEVAFAGKPVVRVAEPACGAGRMVFAFAKAVADGGLDPGARVWFDATDLDRTCQQMTYIQCSLLGLAGVVRHANSISGETFDSAITMAGQHMLITNEAAHRAIVGEAGEVPALPPLPPPDPGPMPGTQLDLF